MIGKITQRASFSRIVSYANRENGAKLLKMKDVLEEDNSTIAESMQRQADNKIGRPLAKPVYHISLSFAQQDADRLTDKYMVQLAEEYMERMGIRDTQYIIVRHSDKEHPHLHIVANRVDNNGRAISDSNDRRRSVQVCRAMTDEHHLYISLGKRKVKRAQLRGRDRAKYAIFDAVKAALPDCRSWSQLCHRLAAQQISVRFRLSADRQECEGVSFGLGDYQLAGSRIDHSLSFENLNERLGKCFVAEGDCAVEEPHIDIPSEQSLVTLDTLIGLLGMADSSQPILGGGGRKDDDWGESKAEQERWKIRRRK